MNTQVRPTPRMAFATLVATIAAVAGSHLPASSAKALPTPERTITRRARVPPRSVRTPRRSASTTRCASCGRTTSSGRGWRSSHSPLTAPTSSRPSDRLLRNRTTSATRSSRTTGAKAGEQLTALLKDHINGAVDAARAAKSGDQQAFASANAAWYRTDARSPTSSAARTRATGGGLRCGNDEDAPRSDTQRGVASAQRRLWRQHPRLRRDPSPHPGMADALSAGIVAQFPGRFR